MMFPRLAIGFLAHLSSRILRQIIDQFRAAVKERYVLIGAKPPESSQFRY